MYTNGMPLFHDSVFEKSLINKKKSTFLNEVLHMQNLVSFYRDKRFFNSQLWNKGQPPMSKLPLLYLENYLINRHQGHTGPLLNARM